MKVTGKYENINKHVLSLNSDKTFPISNDKGYFYNYISRSTIKAKQNKLSLQSIEANFTSFRNKIEKKNKSLENKINSFFRFDQHLDKMTNLEHFLSRLYKMPYENITYHLNTNNIFRDGRQIVTDFIEKGLGGICVDFASVAGDYLDKLDVKWFLLKSDIDNRKDCHFVIKAFIDNRWYFLDPGLYLPPMLIEEGSKKIPSGRYGLTKVTYINKHNSIHLQEINHKNEIVFSISCNLDDVISIKYLNKQFKVYKKVPIMNDLHITRKASNGNLIEFHHGRYRDYDKNGKVIKSRTVPEELYSEFISKKFNIKRYYIAKAKE